MIEYNYNRKYIYKIIKLKQISKHTIAKKLGYTYNCLNIKFSKHAKFYIEEGIIIANTLKIDIYTLFCPSNENLYNVLELNKLPEVKKVYRLYNRNSEYIREHIKLKNLTIKDIQDLWCKKRISIYDKLKGFTKISLEEGIKLGLLLNVDINDLFCPSSNELEEVLNKGMKFKYINIDPKGVKFKLNNDGDNVWIKYLLKIKNLKMKDLIEILGYTTPQVYNKLKNKSELKLKDISRICTFFNMSFNEIFYPPLNKLLESQEFFDKTSLKK